jgi:two-component system chemotaxis response regulator CheY
MVRTIIFQSYRGGAYMARIMIVDDAMIMRIKLRDVLTRLGHDVVAEASDGKQAVRDYKLCHPDIITMDITMPNMNGINAVKQIISETPSANIIVISALAQRFMVIEAIQAGAKNYLIKPFDEVKLAIVISKVLADIEKSKAT